MIRHSDGSEEHLAPVIPLFGNRSPGPMPLEHPAAESLRSADALRTTDAARPADVRTRLRAVAPREDDASEAPTSADPEERKAAAEETLVRKLRSRSLSVSEARNVLKGTQIDAEAIDEIIDRFCHRGYLDDRVLADLLVTSGTQRKGQGRVALGRALAQRGLSRDVIDEAMAALPDDDDERALEFARSKASSMARLDFDTALRRLVGQLARRGYSGSIAMTAARTALREFTPGRATSGVRFVDSDE